ncbi:DUF2795 domain-containing protein [Longispora sp. K20-0274]|uniref:DUF2795 domain-containing protein n=1 Tax=Longispora sp. K20-0274 TaxID=3088255 RepID=UPI00399A78A9
MSMPTVTAVTRAEIADHLEGAFDVARLSRTDLVNAAHARGARVEVLTVLETLPDRTFATLRDIWPHLSVVPIDL